jgi:DNA-binding response OmpR family regulator
MKILVVEDDPVLGKSIVRGLTEQGFINASFSSGKC